MMQTKCTARGALLLVAGALLLPALAFAQAAAAAAAAPPAAPQKAPALRELWRRPIDSGVAGLVAAAGRLHTTVADDTSEYAVALDAADGRELWRVKLAPRHPAAEDGPFSTPAVAGDRVLVVSSDCKLHALEAATGKPVWQHDLKAKFGTGPMRLGCAMTPTVEGGLALVLASGETDNRLVAFTAATGEVAWTSKGVERSFYTSPAVADIGGVRQVVVHQLKQPPQQRPLSGLYGARLADGAVLWSFDAPQGLSFQNPLVLPDDRVALASWNDLTVVRIAQQGGAFRAERAWTTTEMTATASSPVHVEGHLYGFGGEHLVCVDAATGKTVWKEKLYLGSLAGAGADLVVLSRDAGLLRLVEATPAGYKEKARIEVFEPGASSDTPPTVDGRRLYVRNVEEVVAVEITGT